jgi:hypothetical protein
MSLFLSRSLRASSVAALALALAACGKGTGGSCADIDACGGTKANLLGDWTINTVCQYEVPEPYLLMSPISPQLTTPQTPAYAPPPPPTTTSGDWCSGLIYRPDVIAGTTSNVESIQFYHAPLLFTKGNATFTHDDKLGDRFAVIITLERTQTTHFTRSCLDAYGAHPACKDLSMGLTTAPNPNYQPPPDPSTGMPMDVIPCVPTADDGCDCSYTLEGTGSENGTFQLDGGNTGTTIFEFGDNSGKPPQLVDFCMPDNNTLTLGGFNGAALGTLGIRSMELTRAP